jgi:hypothetical protein
METRDIVLALLILVIGVAIFYLLDPTFGGLLKKRYEGFNNFASEPLDFEKNSPLLQSSEFNAPGVGVPTLNRADGSEEERINKSKGVAELPPTQVEAVNTESKVEGFETLTPSPMPFKDAQKPANCFPKDQITPQELLPNDPNSKWAQVNPQGQGDIAGKNYLSAGALIGVNTIGQSLRNANYQLRSDPPNPQVKVSIWNQTTIEPDVNRRSLEIA